MLDDVKHVIGLDPSDPGNLIFENIEKGKADKFRWTKSSFIFYTALFYDEDTGYLYTGDFYDHVYKYKVNIASKSCERVKAYGKLGIGPISSSYRFMNFVFLKAMTVKSES